MKKKIADNIARFFYDTAKLCLAVLILGAVSRRPFPFTEFMVGIFLTLIFVTLGIMTNLAEVRLEGK